MKIFFDWKLVAPILTAASTAVIGGIKLLQWEKEQKQKRKQWEFEQKRKFDQWKTEFENKNRQWEKDFEIKINKLKS